MGKTGYSNGFVVQNTAALAGIGKTVYGRMNVRFGSGLPQGHTAFAIMKDKSKDKELRFGGQGKALQWNHEVGDVTLPEQSPAGIGMSFTPMANQWYCIEFLVDGATGHMNTWVDGTAVTGLTLDDTPTQDVDKQWIAGLGASWRPEITSFGFGWWDYNGGGDITVWYDDVALAPQRIGCSF